MKRRALWWLLLAVPGTALAEDYGGLVTIPFFSLLAMALVGGGVKLALASRFSPGVLPPGRCAWVIAIELLLALIAIFFLVANINSPMQVVAPILLLGYLALAAFVNRALAREPGLPLGMTILLTLIPPLTLAVALPVVIAINAA